jgi:HAD superfamily hydrolase (TIGR01509 family)
MFSNKKAIFWDNDGVLVDTEKYYFEATYLTMKKVGFEITQEQYIEQFLIQATGAWHLLDQNKFSAKRIQQLKEERDDLYTNFLMTRDILIDGVEDILAKLSEKYKMAIVTSSKPNHFNSIHSRTELLKYFSFVVTSEDYLNYKPDPEPYLFALKKMGVNSFEGLAIEDSRRGLIAAKKAGLDCIIMKNELTMSSDFSDADLILEHISQLTRIL